MGKNKENKQKVHIVDIAGLAKVLLCSKSMILNWIYHLSVRRKEVMTLKWEDVDFEKKNSCSLDTKKARW